MAYGYEETLTPLQMLSFYNAVANNGIMVKPHLVSEIKEMGVTVQKTNTEIVNTQICSAHTLDEIKKMLEGVVLEGTATNIKNKVFLKT